MKNYDDEKRHLLGRTDFAVRIPQVASDKRSLKEQWTDPLESVEVGQMVVNFLEGEVSHLFPLSFDHLLQICLTIASYSSSFRDRLAWIVKETGGV